MRREMLNAYALTLDEVRRVVAGLGDEEMARPLSNVPNHPAWTIGHLVFSAQAIGEETGLAPWLPAEWAALFGQGSVTRPSREAYPSKRDLLERLDDAQARLDRHVRSLPEDGLRPPLPDVRFRTEYPTVGDAVLHILVAHTSFHLGQLSVWRRAARESIGGNAS